ncbi:Uncharacterized protein APZ42_033619 [Daphnia magna]|uniref:Uncharacterized protein n=1 Tax=Daphnia magna TaxID=35525 RepID=A0A164KXH1_9CRUS|nr:Uncharacterized protein APZ42_033619 [Daphnia magna]
MPKFPIILTKTIFFSDDDQEKQQIVRQNALEMWKAKTACLLSVLLKRRLRRVLSNNHRPVGTLWTRFHNSEPEREKHSLYTTIPLAEMSLADDITFRNITRMSPTLFNQVLVMVGSQLFKKRFGSSHPLLATSSGDISDLLHSDGSG